MPDMAADLGVGSSLDLRLVRANERTDYIPTPNYDLKFTDIAQHATPQDGLPNEVNDWRQKNYPKVMVNAIKFRAARAILGRGVAVIVDTLYLTKITADGDVLDYGLAAFDLVTTAGANALRDGLVGTVEPETLKYHALGTGATAPVIGNTAMGTEWTGSEYTASVRANANYTAPQSLRAQSVATNTKANAGTSAVTEYGLFSVATPATGTLLARFTFSAVNLAQNDALQGTFNLDINDGG